MPSGDLPNKQTIPIAPTPPQSRCFKDKGIKEMVLIPVGGLLDIQENGSALVAVLK